MPWVNRQRDLELLLGSRTPMIVIETRDESRMLELLTAIGRSRRSEEYVLNPGFFDLSFL